MVKLAAYRQIAAPTCAIPKKPVENLLMDPHALRGLNVYRTYAIHRINVANQPTVVYAQAIQNAKVVSVIPAKRVARRR